jgi:hypothetical protein
MPVAAHRLDRDLEAALLTLVGEGGRHQDPSIRSLALDALVVAQVEGVNWLDQVTIVHGLPGSGDVPMVFAAWTEGR